MHRTVLAALSALILAAPPAVAQQRVDRSNSSTSDSTWSAQSYTFGGATGTRADPTATQAACQPNWRVDSTEACQPDGTQVTHLVDGCGNTQAGSQSCTPLSTASWKYAPISTDYIFTGHYGSVTTYAISRGCYAADGTMRPETECTGTPPKDLCGAASDGFGCCTPGIPFIGLPFQQTTFAMSHFYQCNF